jgi:hypothetical protein
MRDLVEIMGEIVANVQNEILALLQSVDPNIVVIHYEHGHYVEIQETLAQFEDSQNHYNKKYPLVALFEDIVGKETKNGTELRFSMIICYSTKSEYKSKERYQEVINPILKPIYEAIKRHMLESEYFYGYHISHEPIIRPYAGNKGKYGNTASIFSDYLDAIEMRNIKLILAPQNICN